MHEIGDTTLVPYPASTVTSTTDLAVAGPVQYLAVWRLSPAALPETDPVWDPIRRAAAPGRAYLYVPAFSLARAVVQRIGVRLTEVQPRMELTAGAPVARALRPALAEARPESARFPAASDAAPSPPGWLLDAVSPVLVGKREAWGLAHFIYMAIEARELRDLRPGDLQLTPGQEELLFFPAVWDPRYIHESNWRLLLREFDGLVA